MLGGIIGTVLGWLGYHVGQRTDAANAIGSLHSKITDVKNTLSSQSAIKSVQRGIIEMPILSTVIDIPISSVVLAKTVVKIDKTSKYSSSSALSLGHYNNLNPAWELTSATNLRLTKVDQYADVKIMWQVIEYK